MVLGVPNSFIRINMPPNKYSEQRVIMTITGLLVEMLVNLDSETYNNHVMFENGKKVIHVVVMR